MYVDLLDSYAADTGSGFRRDASSCCHKKPVPSLTAAPMAACLRSTPASLAMRRLEGESSVIESKPRPTPIAANIEYVINLLRSVAARTEARRIPHVATVAARCDIRSTMPIATGVDAAMSWVPLVSDRLGMVIGSYPRIGSPPSIDNPTLRVATTPDQVGANRGLGAHNRLGGMMLAGVARTGRAVDHRLS
jgi:hypothetical protein